MLCSCQFDRSNCCMERILGVADQLIQLIVKIKSIVKNYVLILPSIPFALSLSKGRQGRFDRLATGFDRLSPNGVVGHGNSSNGNAGIRFTRP